MQLDSRKLFEQLEKSHQEQKFAPIYFFFGDEPFLVHQAGKYLQVLALQGAVPDFNCRVVMASEVDAVQLRDEIETLPMMASRRFVWVQEAQELSDRQWKELERVVSDPVQSTVLLLSADKIDKRKKSFKSLFDRSVWVEFRKPFENQLPSWTRQIAKGHGLEFTDEALQLFHRLAGSSLGEIDAELRKLRDFLGGRSQIRIEDVAQSVSRSQEKNVFALIELMVIGRKGEALIALADLLNSGQNELGVVSLFARHIRTLLRLKMAEDQGISGQKLAQSVQVPSYFLQDYQKQASQWSRRNLEKTLDLIADTERAIKSSPVSAHLWLENLILRGAVGQTRGADLGRLQLNGLGLRK